MTVIILLLVGAATLGLVGPPPARRLGHRLRPDPAAGESAAPQPSHRRRPTVVIISALTAIPVAAGAAAGLRGVCLGTVAALLTGTIVLLVRRSARRRHAAANRRAVVQACTVLAAQLRIGQVPLTAVRSAAEDCSVLRPAVATADLGGDVAATWRGQAARPGQSGLAELARGWQLSERTGAPMAQTLEDVAAALVEDENLGLVINSEAAGPRASGKIMAALPLVGIGLGYLIGGEPMAFLLGSGYGWACLLLGTGLACAGVLWMEQVANRAAVQE